MKIDQCTKMPQVKRIAENIFSKLQKKFPEARAYKFSLREDSNSYFTTTIEVRVGKKKLMVKKIGASANESIQRSYSALRKRLEKSLHKKKIFLSNPSYC